MKKSARDLRGKHFGDWTVMYENGSGKGGIQWHCKCKCGTEADKSYNALTSYQTQSCGCTTNRRRKLASLGGFS